MRAFLFGSIFLCANTVSAACPAGVQALQTKGVSAALRPYQVCALEENDDSAQLWLGRTYVKGHSDIRVNLLKGLLFYHLAADNGNATAQVELAELLLKLDQSDQDRSQVVVYLDKIKTQAQSDETGSFSSNMLHPYALLALAAEKADQKWYYPTHVKMDVRAARQLAAYQMNPERKQQALKQASLWKQQKMLDTAKEVYSDADYRQFYDTLYPEKGRADPFLRQRAVENLKEAVHFYLKK